MDFTPAPEQTAARDLAAEIFADLATHQRLSALGDGTDAELWKALCGAGLVSAVEEIGLVGLALLLEEQGRHTAQVPLAATCVYGLLPVAAHGTAEQRARLLPGLRDGTTVATGTFPLLREREGVRAGEDGRLSGTVPLVPWLRDADLVLVPARCERDGGVRLFLVGTGQRGLTVTPLGTTAPWAAGRLEMTGARGEPLGGEAVYGDGAREKERVDGGEGVGGPACGDEACGDEVCGDEVCGRTLDRARTAFAALQAGVCAGSLARAVAHTCEREQFGRPLSTNQAVQMRAADAHLDTEAIRVTCYEAAWRHDAGLPAHTHALTAAWWAAEAGRRVVHAGQHLHGGVGADLTHPVHRHFLWGRQLAAQLGSPAALLDELGRALSAPERDTEWRELL
ncbi:acyl-CoA dehydrogenase [Streptomyces albus subsp. chlorinus]|uniref:acyl-CoA dehydrogenase family protein n=1 Tax=Streptomyces albus TaxID=1888 RepID=UPI00156DD8A9|nr:acyl-CoA dehydrogenase family protein [Streptomyces albus]NSC22589.1 acyl-CoA dehydrogenase [Streptomyces albus subsp. chlorinus]